MGTCLDLNRSRSLKVHEVAMVALVQREVFCLVCTGEVKFRTSGDLMGDPVVHCHAKLLQLISPRGVYDT